MKKKRTVGTVILVLALVVIVAAAAWALISGKLSIAWNGFGAQYSTNKVVCDSGFVTEYNKAMEYTYPTGTEPDPSIDVAALKNIIERVKASGGYEADPTCQVMLYWAAIELDDKAAAEQALPAIKELHAKRQFPDNNLRTAVPLFEYEQALEYLDTKQAADAAQ